jgi:hypothetical protein
LEQDGATRNGSIASMLLKDMVGPCGLEPQTSTVSTTYKTAGTAKHAEVSRDIIHCGLECGLEIITEVAPIHPCFLTIKICSRSRFAQTTAKFFRHKRTTQPNVPFAERADITSSPVQQSQELDHARGRACSVAMLPRHGRFLSN